MEIKQAIEIIKHYGSMRGMEHDILATLEHMDKCLYLLSHEELQAFQKFVAVGREFFSPVEMEV